MRDKEYGLVVTPTDTAEGVYKVKVPWNLFKVLNYPDETTGGGFYQGALIGYERKEIIRKQIRKSGILKSKTIFVLLGSGGGGSGLGLEQVRVLLEEVSSSRWVNVVFVISEKRSSRFVFNTMAAFQTLQELLKSYRNLSVTFISNAKFFELEYEGFPQINQDIAHWLVTEVLASLRSQYDVENVISKDDFRFSSVCFKTGVVAREVTENKHRVEELAKKTLDDLWLADEIPMDRSKDVSGVWLLAAVPQTLFTAFNKAKIDAVGALQEVAHECFEHNGVGWEDVLNGRGLNDSLCEIDGSCFPNPRKEIALVSRIALNRAIVEERISEMVACLDRIWDALESGNEAQNPLVRIASTQKDQRDQKMRRRR